MYAVVSSGGKQYRVEPGTELVVERVAGDAGSVITFDRVLLVGDGEAVTVGTPTVEGATVSGTVLGEARGPKLIVFKFKQKATYRRKNGHRQHLSRVRIDEISSAGKSAKVEAPDKPKATATAATSAKRKPAAKPKAEATASAPVEEKPKTTRRRSTAKAAGDAATAEEKPKTTRRRATAKKAEPKAEAEE